jgi:N-alpha-acetyltransferase 35, NatC auxiliary subunit
MIGSEVSSMGDSRENEQKKDSLYNWTEITDEFFESVRELELGELLHYELFGLFEAMSAIEMMDKKMDIGMLEGREKNVPLTFEVAVKVFEWN